MSCKPAEPFPATPPSDTSRRIPHPGTLVTTVQHTAGGINSYAPWIQSIVAQKSHRRLHHSWRDHFDCQTETRFHLGHPQVDASVFPRIPGFFMVSAIYMISERAAAVILKAAGDSV